MTVLGSLNVGHQSACEFVLKEKYIMYIKPVQRIARFIIIIIIIIIVVVVVVIFVVVAV